jgi:quercetin dioxygenase-like cupin family protein
MTTLILKHAKASRPSGEWNDDDYDVLADGVVVGRILKVHAAPVGSPWMSADVNLVNLVYFGTRRLRAISAIGGTAMRATSLTSEQMEARVARFHKLQTYQTQNFEAHNIPPGAVEKVAARRVYPVMAPADYQGRSAGAPVKGPRGLIVSIAECEPGNGPGLHRHLNTVENFLCLSGRFEIAWGDKGEHTLMLESLDMISVPRGENRSFRNISDELGRLLVMIVPETDKQVDPVSFAPSLAKEIEEQYGEAALAGLQKIGFKFEDEPIA